MEAKYSISSDGAKISYGISGNGPALLLVHGMGRDKNIWADTGWNEILEKHFTVIAVDIRGWGESDKSYNTDFYAICNILNDFDTILKENGFNSFSYFGHSYGATIGLQVCRNRKNVEKAICAGTTFGDDFFKVVIPDWIDQYEMMNFKKKNNKLGDLDLSDEERQWVEANDLDNAVAQFKAWNKWQGINPKDTKTKLAMYSGTKDNPMVLERLYKQEEEMKQNNIVYKIFNGLDHGELISRTDVVSPWVLGFLLEK